MYENNFLPQIEAIIQNTALSVWDKIEWRTGSIGFYGFDIMPDSNGKLWLLECNKCPSMEYSTAITAKLVPEFLEDFCSLIIDKTPTNFKKIYESDTIDSCKESQPNLFVTG